MNNLVSEVADLFLTFIKSEVKDDDKKFKIPSDYPLNCSDQNMEIAIDASRYLLFNGGLVQEYKIVNDMKNNNSEKFLFEVYDGILKLVNFVLLPLPFPLKLYHKCCISSTVLMELIDQMSIDLDLLNKLFKPILKYDKFVKDLLEISNEVYSHGNRNILNDLRIHITRSDYFIHLNDLEYNDSKYIEFCKNCHYERCLCKYGNKSNLSGDKELEFKLVETNLGAASVSYHSGILHKVHEKILTTNIIDLNEYDLDKTKKLLIDKEKLHSLNDPDLSFIYPIAQSHNLYIDRYQTLFGRKKVVVFLLTRNNLNNYYDTYFISNDVFEKFGIHVKSVCPKLMLYWLRKKMLFLASDWEYNPDGSLNFTEYSCYETKLKPGRLVLNLGTNEPNFNSMNKNDCYEVSTIYARDFYDSLLMETDELVYLRKFFEYSDAVKIPTSTAQLVNTKRAQMYFSNPDNVDNLLEAFNNRITGIKRNKGLKDLVKKTAILQVDPSLDNNNEIVEDAIKNPYKYVLKSNREAGGACVFGKELSDKLKKGLKNKNELSQYVLMKKILAPRQPSLFVKHLKNGLLEINGYNSLTEVGVYHYGIYDGNECKCNETNGYLARTKPDFATGGGVSAGFGYVNTLLLY